MHIIVFPDNMPKTALNSGDALSNILSVKQSLYYILKMSFNSTPYDTIKKKRTENFTYSFYNLLR